jgi:hypothetical protein
MAGVQAGGRLCAHHVRPNSRALAAAYGKGRPGVLNEPAKSGPSQTHVWPLPELPVLGDVLAS